MSIKLFEKKETETLTKKINSTLKIEPCLAFSLHGYLEMET